MIKHNPAKLKINKTGVEIDTVVSAIQAQDDVDEKGIFFRKFLTCTCVLKDFGNEIPKNRDTVEITAPNINVDKVNYFIDDSNTENGGIQFSLERI